MRRPPHYRYRLVIILTDLRPEQGLIDVLIEFGVGGKSASLGVFGNQPAGYGKPAALAQPGMWGATNGPLIRPTTPADNSRYNMGTSVMRKRTGKGVMAVYQPKST